MNKLKAVLVAFFILMILCFQNGTGKSILQHTQTCKGISEGNPASSCEEISSACTPAPSGYYWIQTPSQGVQKMYCLMEPNFVRPSSLLRVAYMNALKECPRDEGIPGAWHNGVEFCYRSATSPGCTSLRYPTFGFKYYSIIGRVRGFGVYGSTKRLCGFHTLSGRTINDPYVNGISITRGPSNSRQHIWTFAAGWDEVSADPCSCPYSFSMSQQSRGTNPPNFARYEYNCEAPSKYPPLWNPGVGYGQYILYFNNTLWDGYCTLDSSSICQDKEKIGNLFTSTIIPDGTTDEIEVRFCNTDTGTPSADDDNIGVHTLELYLEL